MPEKDSARKVREATHAGIFYAEDPTVLSATLANLLSINLPSGIRATQGIFSPHASMEYAGDLSALAWKASIGRDISRIVILAPLHRSTETAIFLPESLRFDCPLGGIEVDAGALNSLMDCGTYYVKNDIPHFEEHGIEVQLPFARTLYPRARIVPILLGRASIPVIKSLATGLRLVFEREKATTLFVVSSDLAFAGSPSESSRLSDAFLECTMLGSWEELARDAEQSRICGAGCIAALFASGMIQSAILLDRHNADAERENADEAWGEYAALALS